MDMEKEREGKRERERNERAMTEMQIRVCVLVWKLRRIGVAVDSRLIGSIFTLTEYRAVFPRLIQKFNTINLYKNSKNHEQQWRESRRSERASFLKVQKRIGCRIELSRPGSFRFR